MPLQQNQLDALEIVASGEFIPTLLKEDGVWRARWIPAFGPQNKWVDEIVRRSNITPLSEFADRDPHQTLHDAFLDALKCKSGNVNWLDDAECERFARDLNLWSRPAKVDPKSFSSYVFKFSVIPDSDGESSVELSYPSFDPYVLGRAIELFTPLGALEKKGVNRLFVVLSQGETEAFLRTGARALMAAGFIVEGAELSAGISAEGEIIAPEKLPARGPAAELRVKVRVAGEIVGAREIKFLLDQKSPFVFFRGRWIEVDRDILKNALKVLERSSAHLERMDAIRFAQGLGALHGMDIAKLRAHGWLRGVLDGMRKAAKIPSLKTPSRLAGFHGSLRGYQSRGVAWMKFLVENGFGALLADDMGLGKTIETIALLCTLGRESRPCLVVAPLSLLANWRREIESFAPDFKVYVHHGETRAAEVDFALKAAKADVVLTSYALLVKDYSAISGVNWLCVVIDEAQWIKNADTRAAKALKALRPPRRIALTGTPIENSAFDVWSIEEFLNPGFLPEKAEFSRRFAKFITADAHSIAAKQLKHALEPFILRRVKSDKSVAAELGEKREIREYCSLSKRDRAKYEAALEVWRSSEHSQGDIFALITALKLVCDGEGKFERLADLADSILSSGESALIFTQYVKVGAQLKTKLEKHFGSRVAFLHGALSAAEREKEIAFFKESGPKIFILSLRAGGFGLNLVKATHVIHFDRWWNPAVEAQATDRAHRIGQSRTVFVHLMITEGTLEERIDSILGKKLAVSGSLVENGEKFLREMNRREFERIVALDRNI